MARRWIPFVVRPTRQCMTRTEVAATPLRPIGKALLPARPLRSRHEADGRHVRLVECQLAIDVLLHLLPRGNRLVVDFIQQLAKPNQPDVSQFSERRIERRAALQGNPLGKIGKPKPDMLINEPGRTTER